MSGSESVARTADVSVVIPCYRAEATIERAVHSAAAQTVRPREVIVADDASPDGSLLRLQSLQRHYGTEWLKVVALPRNQGAAAARNAGWDRAVGRYVALLDADDAWHPRKIEIQHAWMEAHPDVPLSSHQCVQLDHDGVPSEAVPGSWAETELTPGRMLIANGVDTRTAMLRRDIPQRFAAIRYGEDYLLWLEIVLSGGRAVRLEVPLAYFFKARYGDGGMSGQLWNMEKGELVAYRSVHRQGLLSSATLAALIPFSLAKYARRVATVKVRRGLRGLRGERSAGSRAGTAEPASRP